MAEISAIFRAVDEMSSVMDSMADSGARSIEQWEQAGSAISGAFDGAVASVDGTAQAMQNATATTEQWSAAMDNSVGTASRTADAIGEVGKEAEEAGKKSEEAGNKGQEAGAKSSSAIQTLSSAIAAAGVAKLIGEITDAFWELADAAMEFEVSMAKVSTLADATVVPLSEMESSIKQLAGEMGVSSNQIAEATYQAISGSVDTADAVAFVGEATQLAVGGFTSASTAVNVLTTAVNAYGLEIEDVEAVSSMLITTQNLGKTSVDELASSVGKVIPVAAAYNVEMDNLSAANAELTKGGIETANATTYMRSMLNELGNTSSTVSEILVNETGMSFANLMNEGYSLADVLEVLGDTVEGDGEAFMGLWGAQTAGLGAMALYSTGAEAFNETLLAMQESTGAVSEAYSIMASTTETAKNRMEIAHENMSQSFGNYLLPSLNALYEAGAKAIDWMGNVIDEYPVVAGIITGIGVSLIGVGVAFAAYTAATTIATAVTTAFGVASLAALWPLYLVVAAIGAVVAVATVLAKTIGEANAEYNEMTATTKQTYDQLQELNAEYEEAVRVHGATSETAKELAAQIEAETFAFEAARMTLEQFVAQNDRLIASHDNVVNSFQDNIEQFEHEERSAVALMSKLEALANDSDLTAAGQMQMSAIVGELNKQFPELGLAIDETTGSLNQSVDAVQRLASAQSEQQRIAQLDQSYTALLKDQLALEEQLAIAEAERIAAKQNYDDSNWWGQTFGQAGKDLKALKEEEERLQDALNETNYLLDVHEKEFRDAAAAMEIAETAMVDYETAVSRAINSVYDDLEELVEAYGEAYEAALSSVQGQYSLWDEAEEVVKKSAASINTALESQITYWQNYNENLAGLTDREEDIEGLSEMLASFADGSADSVNAVAGMAAATDEQLADMVANWQTLQEEQASVAESLAELETDFSNSMDEIEDRMLTAIDNMTMEDDAAYAARSTIQSYINEIKSMTGDAEAAAAELARITASALSGNSGAVVSGQISGTSRMFVEGKATGTTDAPDVFVAGEDGPELIVGAGGSTVFPAEETQRILDAVSTIPAQSNTEVPAIASAAEPVDPVVQQSDQTGIWSVMEGFVQRVSDFFGVQEPPRLAEQPVLVTDDNQGNLLDVPQTVSTPETTAQPSSFLGGLLQRVSDLLDTDQRTEPSEEYSISQFFQVERPIQTSVQQEDREPVSESVVQEGVASSIKHIILELKGSGRIGVDGKMDLETIKEYIMENLEPLIIQMVMQNVFEEGNESAYF